MKGSVLCASKGRGLFVAEATAPDARVLPIRPLYSTEDKVNLHFNEKKLKMWALPDIGIVLDE